MEEFLQQTYFQNTVQDYLISIGGFVVGTVLLRFFRSRILIRLRKWSEKTETKLDDIVVKGIEQFMLPILNLILIYYAISYLTLSETAARVLSVTVTAVIAYFAIRIVTSTINQLLESSVQKEENGELKVKQLRGITIVINVCVWAVGLVILFDNLGYNVTAIITGLGIGGIAVALAAQNILGDLFNYFVIFFDRPFEVGDFIVIDDKRERWSISV